MSKDTKAGLGYGSWQGQKLKLDSDLVNKCWPTKDEADERADVTKAFSVIEEVIFCDVGRRRRRRRVRATDLTLPRQERLALRLLLRIGRVNVRESVLHCRSRRNKKEVNSIPGKRDGCWNATKSYLKSLILEEMPDANFGQPSNTTWYKTNYSLIQFPSSPHC